jgi:hypothetical protein
LFQHRSAAGLVQLSGKIYALGGHNGLSIFDSVEVDFLAFMKCRNTDLLRQNFGEILPKLNCKKINFAEILRNQVDYMKKLKPNIWSQLALL